MSQALLSLPVSLCHLVPGVPWGFHRTWFGDTCSQCSQNPFRGMSVSASSPLFPSPKPPTRSPCFILRCLSLSPVTNTHHRPSPDTVSYPPGGRSVRQCSRHFTYTKSSGQPCDLNTIAPPYCLQLPLHNEAQSSTQKCPPQGLGSAPCLRPPLSSADFPQVPPPAHLLPLTL